MHVLLAGWETFQASRVSNQELLGNQGKGTSEQVSVTVAPGMASVTRQIAVSRVSLAVQAFFSFFFFFFLDLVIRQALLLFW